MALLDPPFLLSDPQSNISLHPVGSTTSRSDPSNPAHGLISTSLEPQLSHSDLSSRLGLNLAESTFSQFDPSNPAPGVNLPLGIHIHHPRTRYLVTIPDRLHPIYIADDDSSPKSNHLRPLSLLPALCSSPGCVLG